MRTNVCHSTATLKCLDWNKGYSTPSVTPELPPTPYPPPTGVKLSCFPRKVVLVADLLQFKQPVVYIIHPAIIERNSKWECLYCTHQHNQHELHFTAPNKAQLWFWNWNFCISLWLRFAAVGVDTTTSEPNWCCFCNPDLCIKRESFLATVFLSLVSQGFINLCVAWQMSL